MISLMRSVCVVPAMVVAITTQASMAQAPLVFAVVPQS